MSYVVLARKWRPMSFRDLVGQEHVGRSLANAIEQGRVAHAFLFTGVRGVGKTTSARILAKALNCLSPRPLSATGEAVEGPRVEPCLECSACKEIADGTDVDVREIDGASYTGVDEIRKLQESLPYRPARDRYKIFIVDEVHMLSQNAWNALLKTLEEPPPHVKFILATTEVHKVPVTILSRVQRFDFKMIPTRLIADRIRSVLQAEQIQADEHAVTLVAREAAGSMRDALSLLDQVIAFNPDRLLGEEVARVLGVAGHASLLEILSGVLGGEPARVLGQVDALARQGSDLIVAARHLVALLRDLVVAKLCKEGDELLDLSDQERGAVRELAGRCDVQDLLRVQQGFAKGFDDVARAAEPRTALEMLLARLSLRPALVPLDALLARLAELEGRLDGGGRPAPTGGGPGRPGGPSSPGGQPRGAPGRSGPVPAASAPASSSAPASAVAPAADSPSAAPPGGAGLAASATHTTPPNGPATAPLPISSAQVAARQVAAPVAAAPVMAAPVAAAPVVAAPVAAAPVVAAPVAAAPVAAAPVAAAPVTAPPPAAAGGTARGVAAAASPAPPAPARVPAAPVTPSPAPRAASASSPAGTGAAAALPGASGQLEVADWRRVLEQLGEARPDLVAFLKHAVVLNLTRELFTLGCEPGHALEATLRSAECVKELRSAAARVLGREPNVLFQAVAAGAETLADVDRKVREKQRKAAIDRAEQHPSVRTAAEILGARVKRVELGES